VKGIWVAVCIFGYIFRSAMADLRSKSFGDLNKEVVQSQPYFSAFAHSQSYSEPGPNHSANPNQSANNAGNFNGMKNSKSKSAKSWSLSDPEVKRRKRVASYKVYAVEGRVKASFLKSFRWIKDKYSEMLQGC